MMHTQENELRKRGFTLIAGVDEAGRGPLAGPVVAAAVIMEEGYHHDLIQDSKVLTALQREQLFIEIKNSAISFATGSATPAEIDRIGILEATKHAMRQVIFKLDPTPDFILVDAVSLNLTNIPQKALIKGDRDVFCIAAASIIAKVTRDHYMMQAHKKYPQYGFADHMGYGTEVHFKAIKEHGPCPIHRMTFAPLKDFQEKNANQNGKG